MKISLDEALGLARSALAKAGAAVGAADITARALVQAEAEGLGSHGLSGFRSTRASCGSRARGDAVLRVTAQQAATALVDAGDGLAFPACALAVETAIAKARSAGIGAAAVTNSHHFGVAAYHLEPVAEAGMIGLAMGNSPAAMPVPGGRQALLGTNPLAACFPRPGRPPIVIDLSLSEVARGKIMVAAKQGQEIPLGWALDANGQPTTDPNAALAGSMLPFGSAHGGVKGGMLALVIELLVIGLGGAHFGREADSFFVEEGNQPRIGQFFIAISPGGFAGTAVYDERVEALVAAMQEDDTVRLPGERRRALAEAARRDGVEVADALLDSIRRLAGNA
ncbi:MAG: Ldh family oxidoreductase [Burkholderiaceae bacterium]